MSLLGEPASEQRRIRIELGGVLGLEYTSTVSRVWSAQVSWCSRMNSVD